MKLYRVGATFDSSILVMGEELARRERQSTHNAQAWCYYGKAKHWELCHVDARTGELFTTGQLERTTP